MLDLGESVNCVSFVCGKKRFIRQYRWFLPECWLSNIEAAGDDRYLEVTLTISEWRKPKAPGWKRPTSVVFPQHLWESLFSYLIPDAWIRSIHGGDRSIEVLISIEDPSAVPVIAENETLLQALRL